MMALADVIGDRSAAVRDSAADRARLWSYRERHPEAAGVPRRPGETQRA